MSAMAGADWVYLALRLIFIAAIYWFVAMVVRTALRELRVLASRPAAPSKSDAAAGQLALLDGGESHLRPGVTWDLEPAMTIGRRPGNAVEIDDPFLSGRHAEVVQDAGEWWLQDLGSTNGTLLNGTPVVALTALRPGDIVQFGNVRLQVLAGIGGTRTEIPLIRR
jgi:hypothetical protein